MSALFGVALWRTRNSGRSLKLAFARMSEFVIVDSGKMKLSEELTSSWA